MPASLETTLLSDDDLREDPTAAATPPRMGLALVWSRHEPRRVGEVVLVPAGRRDGRLGRRGPDDDSDHLAFVRQRPGHTEITGPLAAPGISRSQLLLSHVRGTHLDVENVGRRPLQHRGRPVDRARLAPGELVEIAGEALFLCVRRSEALPASRWGAPTDHAFGSPDAWGLVGESPSVWALRDRIAFVARSQGHALIQGATGAGKELVARALHTHGPRGGKPLVARNAATLPAGLIDAELFGNARNYPDAGSPSRPGLVGEADGSTLFLDEIGELPVEQQTHLLRVLDAGEYQRLGESSPRRARFRLVGATNQPLEAMRTDFAARFDHRVCLPPVAERREDIPLLLNHFFAALRETRTPGWEEVWDAETERPRFAVGFMRDVCERPPPTNARGLRALVTSAVANSLPPTLHWVDEPHLAPAARDEEVRPERDWTADEIRACLAKHDGVQAQVWRELGMRNRYQLRRLMKRFDIGVDD